MMPRLSLAFFAAALVAGCSMTHSRVGIPIAGGGVAAFSFNANGAIPAETSDIKIDKAIFDVESKAKGGKYLFAFSEKRGQIPVRVKVEDVTEDPIVPWADDEHPHLTKGRWEWTCPSIPLDDKSLRWLHEIDPSIRIYRFTIVNQDGSTAVVDDASTYSSDVKEFVKKELEPPPAPPPETGD